MLAGNTSVAKNIDSKHGVVTRGKDENRQSSLLYVFVHVQVFGLDLVQNTTVANHA